MTPSLIRVVTLVFWITTFACLGVGCTPPAAPSNTLIYGRGEDANTLDPINTDIGESVNVIINIYDTLVTYDDVTTDIVPALATKWEHGEDGRTWTFDLREGVKFQDGTAFDAAAVVYSFERLLQAEHPGLYDKARPYQSSYRMIESVTAEGDHRVVFKLREPSAVFFKNLTMFPASIVSPTAVGRLKSKFAEQPVGTGPFQFVRWDRDQKIVLAAFGDHWRGRAGTEHVIFVPVKESATRIEQLKRGEIHIADNLPPAELDVLARRADIVVQNQEGMNTGYLTMQMEKPPLHLRDVRRAIAHAVDKQALIKVAYAGQATPAKTLVPPPMWGHHGDLTDYAFDPAKARELLAAASAAEGFTLPLRLSLGYMNQPRPYMQQPLAVAAFLKDSLREVGIDVALEPRDVNEHFDHLMAGKHQLALAGWHSDNNDPDNFLYSLLDPDNISEKGNNLSRYRGEPLHALLIAGQHELDVEKRLGIYRQAQELALEDVPVIPLVHTNMRVAQSPRVKDYFLHPTGLPRLRRARLEARP